MRRGRRSSRTTRKLPRIDGALVVVGFYIFSFFISFLFFFIFEPLAASHLRQRGCPCLLRGRRCVSVLESFVSFS